MSEATAPANDPCERLRQAMRERLSRGLAPRAPSGGFTRTTLEAAWKADANGYGYTGVALASLSPDDAAGVLTHMIAHPNALSSLEAAAGLSVLGRREGLALLPQVRVLTNSQIEYFYARAGLVLLGEYAAAALLEKRSVFRELELLVDACAASGA